MDKKDELLEMADVTSHSDVSEDSKRELDTKLQHYYEVLAEKLSADVAQTVVWEGAAKIPIIKSILETVLDNEGNMWDQASAVIALLFSGRLDSEEEVKEHFLPALKTIATTELEAFREVAPLMLIMLLHKMPENGISLATNVLPSEVYYRLMGGAVFFAFTDNLLPKIKMPKPDQSLTTEEFHDLLVQSPGNLGHRGNVSWIILLGYSPESIRGKLVHEMSDLPWSELFAELPFMYSVMNDNDIKVVEKAKSWMVKTWGDTTTTVERRAALLKMKKKIDHKEFVNVMNLLMTTTTYPLDDMEGEEDEPCLLGSCPTTQLAVKLFRHTMLHTPGEISAVDTMRSLVLQNIGDETLAAIIKELASVKHMNDDDSEEIFFMLLYFTGPQILSCAELMRVFPNPLKHPFMLILEGRDEKTSYKALEILNPDLYTSNCQDGDTNTLHLAGIRGFTTVCKEILARGFRKLLGKAGRVGRVFSCASKPLRPASMAVQTANFATAKVLLLAMELDEAKQLITVQEDGKGPEINLHQVMEEVSKGRGGRWDEEAWKKEEWKAIPRWLEKKEIEERVDFLKTALDTTLEGRYVDLTVLTQDENGQMSEQFSSGKEQKQPDQEEGKKESGESLYLKIVQSDCEELKCHKCFITLTNLMWIDYGIVQGLLLLLYLLFMTFLTTSLVLAAKSTDPSQYDNDLDWFRLFCEVVTLLWVLMDLGLEVYDLGCVIHRSLKQNTRVPPRSNPTDSENDSCDDDDDDDDKEVPPLSDKDEKTSYCLALAKDILFKYILDWQNMLDVHAILWILLIIPFRILDSDVQWVFAALAFMFHAFRIFKYAIMFKNVGEYMAILVLMTKRDVPQFMIVFLVSIFSLGGGLYFALIGHYNENSLDTENNNDTSEVYLLWWTGIRILTEGSVLTYFGPGGFNWLGVLIYWMFLFSVVVVLLSILIAQFSKSYEEETERAQINVILTRTKIIIKMEQSFLIYRFVRFVRMRRLRIKAARSSVKYERVERSYQTGERDENKPASSQQVEELQTQTTNLRLQLCKQIDGTFDNLGERLQRLEGRNAGIETMVQDTSEALKRDIEGKFERAALDSREALQSLKSDMEGKLVGLERAVLDTRRYVDEIKEILMSMKEK